MKMYIKENKKLILLIIIAFILAVIAIYPQGQIFGSSMDWFSQHVRIPEYFRAQFYESGNLFPDYAKALGGGQNIYEYGYYGLFRPDILLGYCLPFLSMKTIIISYMLLSTITSALLMSYWLYTKKIKTRMNGIATLLFMFSIPLLFHAHRQIMFVNYMPFLVLGLIGIDRYLSVKRRDLLIISIFFCLLYSYFYILGYGAALLLYFVYEARKQQKLTIYNLLNFLGCCILAACIAAVLLLPSGAVILEQMRVSDTKEAISFFNLNSLNLLYFQYGLGATSISLFALAYGLFKKYNRMLSISILAICCMPVLQLVLNGGLYARPKILIAFIPLLTLLIADYLNTVNQKSFQKACPITIVFIFFSFVFMQRNLQLLLLFDVIITIIILTIYVYNKHERTLIILSVFSFASMWMMNLEERYLTLNTYNTVTNKEKDALFSQYGSLDYRVLDKQQPYQSSNMVNGDEYLKYTDYTSINNKLYNEFMYDTMKLPMRINNRTAMLASNHIFLQYLMGTKYTYSNGVPSYGYKKVDTLDSYKLYENENVLPIGYATSNLISYDTFNKLEYPYTMDTMLFSSVVDAKTTRAYDSQFKETNFEFTLPPSSQQLEITRDDAGLHVSATKKSSFDITMSEDMNNKVLILSFDVSDVKKHDRNAVIIDVNNIRNKLPSTSAPYYTPHTNFTYVLANKKNQTLNITLSKGNYTFKNMKAYTFDASILQQVTSQIDPIKTVGTNDVLKGSVDVKDDGYFITSLPYQKGYTAYVDGKKVDVEKVNTAFVGFKITKGSHDITISFTPPLKHVGMAISGISIVGFILLCRYERKLACRKK